MKNLLKSRTLKLALLGVLVIVIVFGIVYLNIEALSGSSDQKTVASVNGEAITKDELYNAMLAANGQQALDSLISDKIVDLEIKKQNITVSDADIQTELQKLIDQYGGQETFEQAMASYGYTLDTVKTELGMNLKIKKLLEPGISITEDEMKSYFEQNKANYDVAEQVKVSHILVDTEEKAKEVKSKLAAGADFAELAKQYSTDANTKDAGGEIGYISKGDMAQEFEAAAFSLEVGKISDPVKTDDGYQIIKVEDKKAAKAANYEDSKADVKEALLNEKMQSAYETWLQAKYSEYKIVNYLEQ